MLESLAKEERKGGADDASKMHGYVFARQFVPRWLTFMMPFQFCSIHSITPSSSNL